MRGKYDEACLKLGLYPVPEQTVFNVVQRIDRKPIIYKNALPTKKRKLLSGRQVKYVEDILFKRYIESLGMSRKEVIQVISEISQANLFVQA